MNHLTVKERWLALGSVGIGVLWLFLVFVYPMNSGTLLLGFAWGTLTGYLVSSLINNP